ncbi:MAG: hypothetical protein RLZ25_1048 [Pseudomonadota bacterium]|jgi:hypothetical protein
MSYALFDIADNMDELDQLDFNDLTTTEDLHIDLAFEDIDDSP